MIINSIIKGTGGLIIPAGFAYYNGFLLPQLPTISGYDYMWIRHNGQNDTFDAVFGKTIWYTRTTSVTPDNWQLLFDNITVDGAIQYSIPTDGSATDWGTPTTSYATYYGTAQNRKIFWTNADIKIGSKTGNTLLYHGIALYPPS